MEEDLPVGRALEDGHLTKIENRQRFSKSLLWRLLPLWYQEAGQRAWGVEAVPSYITSNAYIARTYCHLVQAFVRDLQKRHLRGVEGSAPRKPFDPRLPIYVIELGGGHGKFTFLFLKELERCIETQRHMQRVKIVFVTTDVAESNVESLRSLTHHKKY